MRLNFKSEWEVYTDEILGSGGFGTVYAASGPGGERSAAKFVRKSDGATRELLAENLPESPHIVPVIDSGDSEDFWVLIMPRAEQSLFDRMKFKIDITEALDILRQIAQGLADIDGVIVHRDLKPQNVLQLDSKWAICDFGISRYAEATTALETRKFSYTAAYAAPEQWRTIRATPATDVYSLGIIAFELCCGSRPFPGPLISDFRDQHLHHSAPPMALTSRLSGLITECLYKEASARPPASNLVARFSSAGEESKQPGARMLAEAQQVFVENRAETARQREVFRTESEKLAERAEAAASALKLIVGSLSEAILAQAPDAIVSVNEGLTVMTLGAGKVMINQIGIVASASWDQDKVPGFHVVAHTAITVSQEANARGYRGRAHSLYYCDFAEEDQFAWYELGFMWHSFATPSAEAFYPLALSPGDEAAGALGTGGSPYQLALAFHELRPGETDSFNDRWMGFLALASRQQLTEPDQRPEAGQQIIRPPRR